MKNSERSKLSLRMVLLLLMGLLAFAQANVASAAPTMTPSPIPSALPPALPQAEKRAQFWIVVGHESNYADGIWGPFTIGGEGSYDFKNGMGLEGTYVRLREPGKNFVTGTVLDEAQLTLLLKEGKLFGNKARFDVTAWKNRTMDMYTNVGGIEVTREGKITVTGGIYFGTATREEVKKSFVGYQIGVSTTVAKKYEVSISHMGGKIGGDGFYSKTSLEVARDFNLTKTLPFNLAIGTDFRKWAFDKKVGPISEPIDKKIYTVTAKFPVGETISNIGGIFRKPKPKLTVGAY